MVNAYPKSGRHQARGLVFMSWMSLSTISFTSSCNKPRMKRHASASLARKTAACLREARHVYLLSLCRGHLQQWSLFASNRLRKQTRGKTRHRLLSRFTNYIVYIYISTCTRAAERSKE